MRLLCVAALAISSTAFAQSGELSAVGTVVNDDTPAGDCSASPFVDFNGVRYPYEGCTGYEPTGVTLTAYNSPCTITTAGTTIDSRTINCNPLNLNANDITIKRSKINGVVRTNSPARTGLLIEDTTIDGQNATGSTGGQCVGGGQLSSGGSTAEGYILRRVRIVGCEQGFYGRGMRVEASYVHDLYCQGTSHTEPALPNQGEVKILNSTLRTNLRQNDCIGEGGSSAVIACYTHSRGFWSSPFVNGEFSGNWLQVDSGAASHSGFTVYTCRYPDPTPGNGNNLVWKNNVFTRGTSGVGGQYGAVYNGTGPTGPGSCWSNNRYANDGALISADGSPTC